MTDTNLSHEIATALEKTELIVPSETTLHELLRRNVEHAEWEPLADLLRRALAALQQQGWQPIETAPSRKKVLVSWVNDFGKRRTTVAAFFPAGSLDLDSEAPDDMVSEDGTNAEDGWFECREAGDAIDWHLTAPLDLWQPLPALPASGEEDNK